ncbi:MAG: hypothetical protein BGO13_10620 [Burkholderiales bacterium 66-5]|nr:MAG: hypothetical protein BGO13_10620 [Burkholderiales bacterium 66-5]
MFAPSALGWALLFSPRLLPGITWKSLAWVLISAFLFWPLVFQRWSLWLGVAVLAVVGMLDIFYVHYFGALTDEFFLATVFRTNGDEATDFFKALPMQPLAAALCWLVFCALVGWFLERTAPQALASHGLLRWSWTAPALVWAFLTVAYATGDVLRRFEIQDKTVNVYPLHLAWAASRQQSITDAVLYVPHFPAAVSAGEKIGTVVVVLGESATAQRWSLLGYSQEATNAPLSDVAGLEVAQVWARGFMTATALPFVLTGRSVQDSIAHQSPSFLDAAKHAGYKVFVFNNSRASGNGDFFDRVLRRSSDVYQKVGNGTFDGVLTSSLQGALRDPAPLKLIVLHTFGSHEIVADRYPAEYARFTDPYDNSIAYTSALLKQWIALLDGSTRQSALLLYTSDHGLSMPPCSAGYVHGRSLSSLDVPFLAWGNTAVQARMPRLLQIDPQAAYSNALVAEVAIRAVGYGELLEQPDWPSSLNPTFEGHTWQALRQLDACTLR